MQLLAALDSKVRENSIPATASAPAPSGEPRIVDPSVGDLVRVRPGIFPKYEWGEATSSSIGRLIDFEGDHCVVDFPAHAQWHGLLSEMEKVEPSPAALPPLVGDSVRVRPSVAEPAYGWVVALGDGCLNHSSVS